MYVILCLLIRVIDHLRTAEIVCGSFKLLEFIGFNCWKNRPRRPIFCSRCL
ncbi:unnamed protein product [Prunus brigantina]